jgi:curved DNA-binding protein CbpA
MDNAYRILGITADASYDEMKAAYRELSKKYHPDSNEGDDGAAELFSQVNDAYNYLMTLPQYRDFGKSAKQEKEPNWRADISAINMASSSIGYQDYAQALKELTMATTKAGSWYYYKAFCEMHLCNIAVARENIAIAVSMEPGNAQFIHLQHVIDTIDDEKLAQFAKENAEHDKEEAKHHF